MPRSDEYNADRVLRVKILRKLTEQPPGCRMVRKFLAGPQMKETDDV